MHVAEGHQFSVTGGSFGGDRGWFAWALVFQVCLWWVLCRFFDSVFSVSHFKFEYRT